MTLHSLSYEQELGIPLEQAWGFFCDPHNLAAITPAWLNFTVLDAPKRMHPGSIMRYRIRPLGGLSIHWVTEITHVREMKLFVDEQRFGPYRFWHHLHRFEEVPGGVRMFDLVHYRLHGGLLAGPLHTRWVRPRLEEIFRYRRMVLSERFPNRQGN